MRFLGLLCLFSAFLLVGNSTWSSSLSPVYDIVFDIDLTLTEKEISPARPSVEVRGERYQIARHFGSLLAALKREIPNVRISFYSGGSRIRNETLLRQVRLPDGRSAFNIADRILSFEDLVTVSTDTKQLFSERHKKSLTKLAPNADARRTLLIDDKLEFAIDGLKVIPSLGDGLLEAQGTGVVGEGARLARERRTALWLAVLLEAYRRDQISPGSFAEEAVRIMEATLQSEVVIRARLSQGETLLLKSLPCAFIFLGL